jgi:hypothetical protein
MPPKVATRSSLEQVAILDALLARPTGATMPEMTAALDCHERTVRRHVAWMNRKFGVRILTIGVGEKRSWVYLEPALSIFTPAARRHITGARL